MAWLISAALGVFGGLALSRLVSWELVRRGSSPINRPDTALICVATAFTFTALTWRFLGAHVTVLAAYLFFGALCVAVTAIDVRIHKIPDRFVFPSFVLAGLLLTVASIFGGQWVDMGRALACALVGYAMFYLLSLTGGMGLGDVKLAAILGAYCGWLGWSTAGAGVIFAFVTGGVWATILVLTRKAHRQTAIAFGPWLCVGALLGILIVA